MKRLVAAAATAALALTLTAGPAAARPDAARAGGDGACVAAGVKTLKGAIGTVAPASPPGTIAAVILAHTNGEAPVTNAC
jgi:hypothetical protein